MTLLTCTFDNYVYFWQGIKTMFKKKLNSMFRFNSILMVCLNRWLLMAMFLCLMGPRKFSLLMFLKWPLEILSSKSANILEKCWYVIYMQYIFFFNNRLSVKVWNWKGVLYFYMSWCLWAGLIVITLLENVQFGLRSTSTHIPRNSIYKESNLIKLIKQGL